MVQPASLVPEVELVKAPSEVAIQSTVKPGVQGRVATVHSIPPNVKTLKPTSPAPAFRPTPIYALVRRKIKPPPPASNSKEQTSKENSKEHELRLGPLPSNQHKKSEGVIEQSQLIPKRKELEEKTDQQIGTKAEKLTSDPSFNLVENSIKDSFRPNVKETALDFQPTLRPSQLSTEDPFLALFRPLGATFSPPASLQKPPNINLLDWLASKSKLRKSSEANTEATFPSTSSSTATPASREENFYESFDFFSDNQYDVGGEIFEPEGQLLVVSMEDVDEDKVISSDIIYYDHEETNIPKYTSSQDENDLFSEEDVSDSRPDEISKRVGEEIDMADQQIWQKVNAPKDEQYDTEEDMMVDESQNSFIVYPSNYVADFEEEKDEEIDDFVTSPIDINPVVEVITPISSEEEFVTKEKIEDVMEKNNKIVDILKNTLQMQSVLFNKFFGYVG